MYNYYLLRYLYLHANFISFVLLLAEPKELLATQKYGMPS